MRALTRPALLAGLLALTPLAALADGARAVLGIGGAVTEIVFALGQQHRLVARDTTSSYPPQVTALPDVGYMRALSPEGVLSVAPDLILAAEGAGPPETIEVLNAANIAFVTVPEGFTAAAIAQKIRIVGDALGTPDKAAALAQVVTADLDAAIAAVPAVARPKRVMFLISAQGGKLIAAGNDTAAAAVIEMAGGVNAVDGFDGYKPLTDEAATMAAPDVVLMMARGGGHDTGADDLFALPALSTTSAAAHRALVKLDGVMLLGFGPRTPQAVRDLSTALYGE